MSERTTLGDLVGEWAGPNQLWLMPGQPAAESETRASVSTAARGAVAVITYAWTHDDQPHEGILTVREADGPGDADVVWYDTFHTGGAFMVFGDDPDHEGLVAVRGSYAAPPGPDWGWRIVIEAEGPDEMVVRMFNITPDGQEAPAVESRYQRAEGAR